MLKKRGFLTESRVRRERVEAIIDTGAVMNLLPEDWVRRLGLEVVGTQVVTVADCLVGPPSCVALVGQLVLERLDLIVDPARRAVTARPESPDFPTLNLLRAHAGSASLR